MNKYCSTCTNLVPTPYANMCRKLNKAINDPYHPICAGEYFSYEVEEEGYAQENIRLKDELTTLQIRIMSLKPHIDPMTSEDEDPITAAIINLDRANNTLLVQQAKIVHLIDKQEQLEDQLRTRLKTEHMIRCQQCDWPLNIMESLQPCRYCRAENHTKQLRDLLDNIRRLVEGER